MGRYWGGRAETHIWAKPSPRTPPQLFFIVTGFTHSLGQVAKITGFMMKKEGKKLVEKPRAWKLDGMTEPGVDPIHPKTRGWHLDQRRAHILSLFVYIYIYTYINIYVHIP